MALDWLVVLPVVWGEPSPQSIAYAQGASFAPGSLKVTLSVTGLQRDGLVRSRVHRGRHIADSGGGRGRAAPRSARVGDGERHGVRAVVRVRVRGPDTGPGGPVAEA